MEKSERAKSMKQLKATLPFFFIIFLNIFVFGGFLWAMNDEANKRNSMNKPRIHHLIEKELNQRKPYVYIHKFPPETPIDPHNPMSGVHLKKFQLAEGQQKLLSDLIVFIVSKIYINPIKIYGEDIRTIMDRIGIEALVRNGNEDDFIPPLSSNKEGKNILSLVKNLEAPQAEIEELAKDVIRDIMIIKGNHVLFEKIGVKINISNIKEI